MRLNLRALIEHKPLPRPKSHGGEGGFTREETYEAPLLVATATKIIFQRGKHIISCFDLQTCSKIIEDGAIALNTTSY